MREEESRGRRKGASLGLRMGRESGAEVDRGIGTQKDASSARTGSSRAPWSSERRLLARRMAVAPHGQRALTPEQGRWCKATPSAMEEWRRSNRKRRMATVHSTVRRERREKGRIGQRLVRKQVLGHSGPALEIQTKSKLKFRCNLI
jgi:hypothetical protein